MARIVHRTRLGEYCLSLPGRAQKNLAMKDNLLNFKLVYRGGHHTVYCDDRIHLTTYGGTVSPDVYPVIKQHSSGYPCDCGYYEKPLPKGR